jgi:hypothetical protein
LNELPPAVLAAAFGTWVGGWVGGMIGQLPGAVVGAVVGCIIFYVLSAENNIIFADELGCDWVWISRAYVQWLTSNDGWLYALYELFPAVAIADAYSAFHRCGYLRTGSYTWYDAVGAGVPQPPSSDTSAPNVPSTPSGPTSGYTGATYSYSTNTTAPNNDTIRYTFDWGDGSTTTVGWYNSGDTVTATHSWSYPSYPGTFNVRVKAEDSANGTWSGWSKSLPVSIVDRPNTPSTPSGPTLVCRNVWCTYSANATDPAGNYVYYQFNLLGPGGMNETMTPSLRAGETVIDKNYNWTTALIVSINSTGAILNLGVPGGYIYTAPLSRLIGPWFPSGQSGNITVQWNGNNPYGTYCLQARAEDAINGLWSDWSPCLPVNLTTPNIVVTAVIPTVTINNYVLEVYGAYPTWQVKSLGIIVTVQNNGGYANFNVTAYCNSIANGTQNIVLAAGAEENLTFSWNIPSLPGYPSNKSAAWPYPTYVFSAKITGTNNTYVNPTPFIVKWPGDANGDGKVDSIDLSVLAHSWYAKVGSSNYNAQADFNIDGVVNSIDLSILSHWWYNGPLSG